MPLVACCSIWEEMPKRVISEIDSVRHDAMNYKVERTENFFSGIKNRILEKIAPGIPGAHVLIFTAGGAEDRQLCLDRL